MHLKSQHYPNIKYEKGEEIFFAPEEIGTPFYFDVEEELTLDDEAMSTVGVMLDEVDTLVTLAKASLKKILQDKEDRYHETVAYFMEFHKEELDIGTVSELFPSRDATTITFVEMVDFLAIQRFGSLIHTTTNQQLFILDLSFNPELTDELMVIYFNLEKQIVDISHES